MLRVIAAGLVLGLGLVGQTASSQTAFEVASIKPHASLGGVFMVGAETPAVRISGTNVSIRVCTLKTLIQTAYDVKDYQISGVPDWAGVGGDYYDVEAKAPGDVAPSTDQVRLMLRSLLDERFHLKLHRDSREMAVYHLVAVKNGAKLKPIAADAPRTPLPRNTWRGTMEQLSGMLARQLDRPMIDQTGLTGTFEYTMNWGQMDIARRDNPDGFGAGDLSTAIQDQLGLKLESAKESFPVVIVDVVEKPIAN